MYASALIASYAIRGVSALPTVPSEMNVLDVPGVDGDRRSTAMVRLAYREYSGPAHATPILLLHGSPGDSSVFAGVAPLLAARRRVLVPDLPGFGLSTTTIPDYSFRAHARYVRELLDARGISTVHVLGFSMGGGVALSLADIDQGRFASLEMVSTIGVQEMELLGEYHVNHALHGVQLAGLWLASRAIPHLGTLDEPLPYARNFFDSDQRPLARVLGTIRVPTLIVHGRVDPLVPIEAAVEHARLIPQSELHVIEDDHFMVFENPTVVAKVVNDFLARTDAGRTTTRERATAARVAAAAAPVDRRIIPRAHAVTAMVLGVLMTGASAASIAVSTVAAGVVAAQNRVSSALTFICCVVGSSLPTLRRRSLVLTMRAAASAAARVTFGILAGGLMLNTAFLANAGAWTRAAVVTAVAAATLWLLTLAVSYRRRRLLVSSWLRLTHWEYWPPWVTYAPVAAYVATLMMKYRALTAFTAANTTIPAGGFVGESKIDILRGLGASEDLVARTGFIEGRLDVDAKVSRADRLMRTLAIGLPVVLKPNEGQRGSGVVVARSRDELIAHLRQTTVDTLVQEYVPGLEFGVYYSRHTGAAHGRILSITRKMLPAVIGDGQSTLERLILTDRRTLGMARFHLSRNDSRLDVVPAAGEVVSLGDCGSHCRGATFLDGRAQLTPAIERVFDEMARAYDGFYFGRFDVRVGALDDFAAGRKFKVIELNGVTSEATHIYDPAIGLRDVYRALFEQWRLAFEIGAENISRGVPTSSLGDLIKLLMKYRHDSRGHLVASLQSRR